MISDFADEICQALIYGRTKGEIYVSRGENVLYLTTYTAKYPELPTYTKRIRSYYNAILRNINTKNIKTFIMS
jgi:hypothetical protein